jgi:hypothetical protein
MGMLCTFVCEFCEAVCAGRSRHISGANLKVLLSTIKVLQVLFIISIFFSGLIQSEAIDRFCLLVMNYTRARLPVNFKPSKKCSS